MEKKKFNAENKRPQEYKPYVKKEEYKPASYPVTQQAVAYPKKVKAPVEDVIDEKANEVSAAKFRPELIKEMKIYGLNACLAAFECRPKDIVRVYVDETKVKNAAKILKYCAENKIAYKVIPAEELNKVTEATHHEGICFIVKKKPVLNFKKFLEKANPKNPNSCVVVLEHVQNPHNVGAILRVCANFGVGGVLLEDPLVAQSAATYRTSEGGAEWVHILETGELLKALEEFKKQGYKVIGTSSHSGKSLTKTQFSEKCVFLFGSEANGLSMPLLKACDQTVYIPQSGKVESLNVACAASVILYEYAKGLETV